MTRHQDIIFPLKTENLQPVSFFSGKAAILLAVSQSGDYGGVQRMAEVVEIRAWRGFMTSMNPGQECLLLLWLSTKV